MLRKLTLAGIATLVALVFAEIAVRIYERVASPPAPAAAATLDPELAALPELSGVLALARPNTRGRYMNVLWQTNSWGLRGPDFPEVPALNTYRIAMIGDSFVAGVGVPEPEIYAEQLARMLAQAHTGTPFEVVNFGLPGTNLRMVLNRAELMTPRYSPRLFVYGFTLNDIFEVSEEAQAGAPADLEQLRQLVESYRHLPSHLLRALIPRLNALRESFTPTPYAQLVIRSYAEPDKIALLRAGFGELKLLATRYNACAHVLVHTDLAALRFGHHFGDAYDTIVSTAREAGLTASSSYPDFRWHDSARLRLNAFDGHPNAEGHRILAESLYDALRDLPPSCGLPRLPARGDN